jgi:hypothetical protein
MTPKETAFERDARGVCIICEESDPNRRLGLCVKHYTRFRKALRRIPPDKRDAFEEHLVEAGLLMPKRKGRRVDPREDVYADAAAEFLSGHKPTPAEQLAEHMADQAVEEQAAAKPPKKGRAGAKRKKT